jgi:hypothetical protein
MDLLLVAQAFGILSFLIGIYTFTQKNDQKLKLSMLALFTSQTIHFLLMGSSNGAIANFLSLIRTLVSIKFANKWVGAVFIGINIVWGAPGVNSVVDILPILGACIGTYAIFFLSGIAMRLAFVLGAIFWITNNIIIGSIGGILLESMVISMNLITIWRIHKDNKVSKTDRQ